MFDDDLDSVHAALNTHDTTSEPLLVEHLQSVKDLEGLLDESKQQDETVLEEKLTRLKNIVSKLAERYDIPKLDELASEFF